MCLENNTVIQKFINNNYPSFQTYKKTRFLFQILSTASSSFLYFLQQIYKKTDGIETQVRKSLQNKELFRMLELQKSLTYFNFALHANENVMERLMRLRNSPIHTLLKCTKKMRIFWKTSSLKISRLWKWWKFTRTS